MIKLKKITLNNFLSFKGNHEIEFPEKGLVFLKGICEDNLSRSNGAGKSSFLEGIAYALDYGSCPATELKNWNSDDDFSVKLIIDCNGSDLEITRSQGLYSVLYQEKIYKSIAAKEIIKNLLYSPEFISFMTYRQQGVFGNFLSLNNNDKFDFLSNLLDMSIIENVVCKSENILKSIEDNLYKKNETLLHTIREKQFNDQYIVDLNNTINKHKASKKELEDQLNDLLKIDFDKDYSYRNHGPYLLCLERFYLEREKIISKHKDLEFDKNKQFKIIEKSFDVKIEELNKSLSFYQNEYSDLNLYTEEEFNKDVKQCDDKIKILKFKTEDLKEKVNNYQILIAKKEDNKQKVKKLNENICFTCSQEWIFNPQILKDLNKEIELAELYEKKLPSFIFQIRCFEQESIKIELEKKEYISKYEKNCFYKNKIKDLNEKIELEKKHFEHAQSLNNLEFEKLKIRNAQNIENLNIKINNLKSDYENNLKIERGNFLNKIEILKNKISDVEKIISDNKNQIIKFDGTCFDNKIKQLKFDIAVLKSNKEIEEEVINCLGKDNFSSLIFQDVLDNISGLTNDFLRNISNSSNFSILFETEKVSQKGIVKKGINLKIFQKGKERSYKMLSGGEKCAVNFSIDIAICHVLSNRFGKAFSWIIYDEPFDSMEVLSKAESIEFLKKISKDKLIILVEHNNEIAELFDKFILVKKENGFSSIDLIC